MPIEKIDIVMFSMSEYGEWQSGIVNRNFYVLHTLLQDPRVRKVVTIDYLPFTWKRAARQWFQNVMRGVDGKVVSRGLFHKLTAVRESEIERTGFSLAGFEPTAVPYRLFCYSDVRSVFSEYVVYRQLQHDLKRLDLKNVVLWSYVPTFVRYFGKFGEELTVFDAVDNWLEHSSYAGVRERITLNYQTIRYKADLIFTTSQDLVNFFDRPTGCTFVPNGAALSHIEQVPKLVDREVANLPRPIIGYVGTMQEDRIDIDLIAYLAKANPTKSFVLVGPVWPGLKQEVEIKLKQLPNVVLTGRKSFIEARMYIREFAVAIVPYLQNDFNRHANPMKVYEYLAAGKPVVATPGPGLEVLRGAIRLAATPEAFNDQLLKALDEVSPQDVERRMTVAREHSWEARVNSMLDNVFRVLNERG